MSANLGDILKKLGWDNSFQVPLANEENKALERELANLSLRKGKAKNQLEVVSGRLDALKDHFKFVSQESEQTQKLLTAQKQRIDFLEDQFHVTSAEKENIERSIKTTLKELKEGENRQKSKRNDLEKLVCKADQIQNEMDWDANALKAWEETLKKQDEDNDLIQRFSKEDEMRYNLLEAKRQHLQTLLTDMRAKASKISSNACNQELVLERSGKVMKQLIFEREALTTQWKEAIKMMHQRDNDVVHIQEQIMVTLELIQKEEEKLDEENNFLNNEKRNNRELELDLQKINAVHSKMRRELNDLSQHMIFLNSELQSLKREVATSAQYLQQERIKNKRFNQLIEDKTMKCTLYAEEIEKIKKKMLEMKESTVTSNERIKNIENMIDKEQKFHAICVTDTEKINSTLYRLDKLFLEQKEIGKTLEININNVTCNCTQLRKHIQLLKKELDQIKEVVYDMEFRIDDIEKKICKIDDENKADADTEEKDKRIQELEKILSYHKDVQRVLQLQVDRLQEDMRRVANVIASEKEIVAEIQNKCESLRLVLEIGQKQINAAKKLTQERQVEENMMRLRVNQIENERKKEEKNIFSLEKLRLKLDQAMKERQVEINATKSIIQAKKRNLEEDRGRLKADIALRRLKIEQIKKKYYLALTSLGQNEDGENVSITQIKIKNAQEKFMLQKEGDELDQKIKTAEKEIIAMENTLKVVNLSNHSFKNSLSPVKDNDEEIEDMKCVEDDLKKVQLELKQQKRNLNQKEQELEEVVLEFTTVQKIDEECQDVVAKLEDELLTVKRQDLDKVEKLKRADCTIKKILKSLEKSSITQYERDFEIRQMRDLHKSVRKQLLAMCTQYPETSDEINHLVMAFNIQLHEGKPTPSTSGSSYSTMRSYSSSSSSDTYLKSHSQSISTVTLSLNN